MLWLTFFDISRKSLRKIVTSLAFFRYIAEVPLENSAMTRFFRYIAEVPLKNSALAYFFRHIAEKLHRTVILQEEYSISCHELLPFRQKFPLGERDPRQRSKFEARKRQQREKPVWGMPSRPPTDCALLFGPFLTGGFRSDEILCLWRLALEGSS